MIIFPLQVNFSELSHLNILQAATPPSQHFPQTSTATQSLQHHTTTTYVLKLPTSTQNHQPTLTIKKHPIQNNKKKTKERKENTSLNKNKGIKQERRITSSKAHPAGPLNNGYGRH